MKVAKFLKYIPIILINYVLIFFLVYIISGFLLIKNVTTKNKLITEYQRNFYLHGGLRNIWQSREECVEFDEDLVFIPKIASCNFKNLEYETKVTFDDFGRYSKHPKSSEKGIAVIGDSHAMGWGVNDDETFSYLLEKKIQRPVYNLAVSGYGTVREIIRLEKSNLLDKVDTVIIQYCYNDVGENLDFKKNNYEVAKEKFDMMVTSKPVSNYRKLRKAVRYSATIPFDIITKKNQLLDFEGHKTVLLDVLKNYPSLNNKKIIILYINGFNMKFFNFPKGKSKKMNNVYFLDINVGEEYFFKIDGHLSSYGHSFVADEISKKLN